MGWGLKMEIRVPRAFRNYACERSLQCCRAPILAPIDAPEEAALRAALATTEAGQALLPTLSDTIDRAQGTWRQQQGTCVHLEQSGSEGSCRLHAAAGLRALPIGCRNFPRIVNATEPHTWDVTFELMCPTAARLMAEDPGPWELVTQAGDGTPYPPSRRIAPTSELLALRDGWWALLREVRTDPERLVAAIGAMLDTPEAPPAADQLTRISDAVIAAHSPMASLFTMQMLASRRERGPTYDVHGQKVLDALLTPWSKKAFVNAVAATPEYVAVFVEHGIGLLTMHATGTPAHILGLTARRALALIRVVETLCDLVPFRTATIFADAYQAVARIDPSA